MTHAPVNHDDALETPVALCIFNRPDVTRQVFERIAQVRPRQLFVFADGPRPHVRGERDWTQAARDVVSRIDWNCDHPGG